MRLLRPPTVRGRVLGYLVALAAAAVAVAGLADYAFKRAGIDREIESDLATRTQAFFDLASADDPATGEPWASTEELMRAAISQVIVSPTESVIGHVDGIPRFVPGGENHLQLEEDPVFMETARTSASADVVVRSARSDLRDYRFVSVPLVDEEGTVLATFTIATDRSALIGELNRTFRAYLIAGVGALLIIGAIGWVTVGRLLRPIRLLDETTREISETDLTQRIPIIGDDDLARLSETVNAMLDRLEEAFAAQRRLLDDAGHELRTPLAVMRTSLELLEPRDERQVAETQAVLLDEVAMMSRLVDDLVVLAQAERPEFVRPKPLGLGDFTDAAFSRAQTLGDRDWSLEARGEGTFCGDAQRLTQAWMQLVSNAVKFSPPGSPVGLGSSLTDGRVRLWVRDAGKGIPKKHQAQVLERFQRLDESVDGAGLGLPIVAAIAHAHGGLLEVKSTPGTGSLFTIVVPLRELRS